MFFKNFLGGYPREKNLKNFPHFLLKGGIIMAWFANILNKVACNDTLQTSFPIACQQGGSHSIQYNYMGLLRIVCNIVLYWCQNCLTLAAVGPPPALLGTSGTFHVYPCGGQVNHGTTTRPPPRYHLSMRTINILISWPYRTAACCTYYCIFHINSSTI